MQKRRSTKAPTKPRKVQTIEESMVSHSKKAPQGNKMVFISARQEVVGGDNVYRLECSAHMIKSTTDILEKITKGSIIYKFMLAMRSGYQFSADDQTAVNAYIPGDEDFNTKIHAFNEKFHSLIDDTKNKTNIVQSFALYLTGINCAEGVFPSVWFIPGFSTIITNDALQLMLMQSGKDGFSLFTNYLNAQIKVKNHLAPDSQRQLITTGATDQIDDTIARDLQNRLIDIAPYLTYTSQVSGDQTQTPRQNYLKIAEVIARTAYLANLRYVSAVHIASYFKNETKSDKQVKSLRDYALHFQADGYYTAPTPSEAKPFSVTNIFGAFVRFAEKAAERGEVRGMAPSGTNEVTLYKIAKSSDGPEPALKLVSSHTYEKILAGSGSKDAAKAGDYGVSLHEIGSSPKLWEPALWDLVNKFLIGGQLNILNYVFTAVVTAASESPTRVFAKEAVCKTLNMNQNSHDWLYAGANYLFFGTADVINQGAGGIASSVTTYSAQTAWLASFYAFLRRFSLVELADVIFAFAKDRLEKNGAIRDEFDMVCYAIINFKLKSRTETTAAARKVSSVIGMVNQREVAQPVQSQSPVAQQQAFNPFAAPTGSTFSFKLRLGLYF